MANRIIWQPMREIAAASITTTDYQPLVDPAFDATDPTKWGIVSIARQFFIQNLTDQPVFVSFNDPDGLDDVAFTGPSTNGKTYRNLILPPNGYFVSDISTNKLASPKDDGPALHKGTVVNVKNSGSASTTGSVYFSYWCESGD